MTSRARERARADRLGSPRLLAPLLLLSLLPAAGCSHMPKAIVGARGIDALRLEPVGRFDFETPETGDPTLLPEELSGITWVGGEEYLAIGDDHAVLHRLTIQLDPETGRVLDARMGLATPLRDAEGQIIPDSLGSDREGLIYDPATDQVWISNEDTVGDQTHPSIARHRLRDGRQTALVRTDGISPLRVFGMERLNGGFEALTRRPDGSEVWTANEMPLTIDGDTPTDSTGGLVRLQRMDADMRPLASYPYPLDPYQARILAPPSLAGYAVNGLSELLALPDGPLLALERSFAGDSTGGANLRIRIYGVDLAGATELSRLGWSIGLKGRRVTPARKRLLWESNFGLTNSNFEGMTLGPPLREGEARPLILIADNNGGGRQALFVLRLTGSAAR